MPSRVGSLPPLAEAVAPAAARERILDAALSLFASHGFEGASTREVALAAGVQQGLVGYHFGSKGGLWRAVVDAGFARLGAAAKAREPIAALEPRLRLRLRLERALELAIGEPLLLRVACHAMLCGGPRLGWLVEQHLRPLQDALRQALASVVGGAPAPGLLERQLVGWLAAQVALEVGLSGSSRDLPARLPGRSRDLPAPPAEPSGPHPSAGFAALTLQTELDSWLGAVRVPGGGWSVAAAQRRAIERQQAGR